MKEQEILKKHSEIFEYLINFKKQNDSFTFSTRVNNRAGKLEKGYYFQGNDNYIFVPLYKVGSDENMTKTIGFVYTENSQYIEIVYKKIKNFNALENDMYLKRVKASFNSPRILNTTLELNKVLKGMTLTLSEHRVYDVLWGKRDKSYSLPIDHEQVIKLNDGFYLIDPTSENGRGEIVKITGSHAIFNESVFVASIYTPDVFKDIDVVLKTLDIQEIKRQKDYTGAAGAKSSLGPAGQIIGESIGAGVDVAAKKIGFKKKKPADTKTYVKAKKGATKAEVSASVKQAMKDVLKNELIYLHEYKSGNELISSIEDFAFVWYNHVRPHSFNDYKTPFEARYGIQNY